MPKPRSSRSNDQGDQFLGPIIDVRFVSLVDGRKILQFRRTGEYWRTPRTTLAMELDENEKAEIIEALGHGRDQPEDRHENGDGV